MKNAMFQHARSLSNEPMRLNKDQVFRPGRKQADHFTETKRLMGQRLLAQLGGSCRTGEVHPLVKCPALVGFGMLDSTSIAESVAQLVGLLGGRVEKMIMPDGDPKGNGGTHDLFEERSTIWCEALKAGKPYP